MRRGNATLGSVAPFTMIALVANVALYVVSAARSKNLMNMDSLVLLDLGGSTREGMWDGEWIRLVAPMFLHGGLIHIIFNMHFLWRAGPDAEVFFGTPNFGTIYLLSGVTGICFSQIFGGNLSIGASTSLCGIMGAHLAVLVVSCPVPRNAWRNAAVRAETFNLALLLAIGILGFFRMDNWGHFGGMVGGLILGGSLEAWRRQKAGGKLGFFASLIFIALLVCAARWTVFNPVYHIYRSTVASEELKDSALAKEHAAEAMKWGRTWKPIHFLGVLNDGEAQNIMDAHARQLWTRDQARRWRMLSIKEIYGSGTLDIPFKIILRQWGWE